MKHFLPSLVFTLACASFVAAQAQTADHSAHHGAAPATPAAAAAADMATGEVRKIDKNGGKLTLRHGEIKTLDMPPMTMVFNVKDTTVLDRFKVGDKVKFRAVDDAGKLTVTDIAMAN